MKKLLLALIGCFLFTALMATTIVIYITPDFVVMGADSKGLYTNIKTFKEEVRIVPKIFKSGAYYFALSGVVQSSFRSFNVSRIVDHALKKDTTIQAAIGQIKTNVAAAIKSYLAYNRKYHPALFRQDLQNGVYITSIGIVGIIDQQPYAHILGFKVTNGKDISIAIDEDVCPSSLTTTSVYYLGKSDAIKNYMDTLQQVTISPDEFVNKLILLQIERTPQYVGPPIDIIELTPKETIWIRKKATTPVEYK